MSEIYFEFRKDCASLSLQSLLIFIDTSRITRITMISGYFDEFNQNTWTDIGIFMEQVHNLSSLIIQKNSCTYKFDRTIENIHSIIPRHVKHLQMLINNVNQIKMILGRCENLSTITFDTDNSEFVEDIINWFADNTFNTTCRRNDRMVAV